MANGSKRLKPDQQHLAVMLPNEAGLGPAMLALGDRQRLFVLAVLNQGPRVNYTAAAKVAGYEEGSRNALRVQAHRLAHDERVQAAIVESARRQIQAGTAAASSLVVRTIGNPKASTKERLRAAEMVLDRGGIPARTEHHVQVTKPLDRVEKMQRIFQLAKEVGLDPRQLLGNCVDVIDADFKVIDELEAKPAHVDPAAKQLRAAEDLEA